MFTPQDFEEAMIKKMVNEVYKAFVRNNYPKEQADAICNAVDTGERLEHFQKMYNEFNNMLVQYWNQQLQYMQWLTQQGFR